LGVVALGIGLIFPLWGLSLIAVVLIDIAVETLAKRRPGAAVAAPTIVPTRTEAPS
jgi:uncharacterized iron-regulated membrane protein